MRIFRGNVWLVIGLGVLIMALIVPPLLNLFGIGIFRGCVPRANTLTSRSAGMPANSSTPSATPARLASAKHNNGSDFSSDHLGIRFVATHGMDTNDCSNPANACRTVQRAVDVAAKGDIIKVATGVYTDDDISDVGYVVALTKSVTLHGGYDETFLDPPHPLANRTILDAQGQGRVISITGDIVPRINGFVITGGNASGLGGALVDGVPADLGGSICIINASPIILNNVIGGNVASTLTDTIGVGGGIGLQGGSAPAVIENNKLFFNIASTGFRGQGGGLYLGESVATVRNNTVYSNTGSTANRGIGGGLYVSESEATIRDNLFQDNIGSIAADGVGGGVAVFSSDNTVVSGNTVLFNIASTAGYGKGGGLAFKQNTNLLVSENHVERNICTTAGWGAGGGILVKDTREAEIIGNTVLLNISSTAGDGRGGGLYLAWDSRTLLSGNRVQENVASTVDEGFGGGLLLWSSEAITLTNNVLADNQANTAGSGLYIRGGSARLLHTTFAHNTGGDGSGVHVADEQSNYSNVILTNTILVSHTVGIYVATGGIATLVATLWGSGAWANDNPLEGPGTIISMHNYQGDPAFVDPDAGDYHIGPDSAAVDAGVEAGVTIDIDGEPRGVGSGYDIGADEYLPEEVILHRLYLPVVWKQYVP